MRIPILTRRRAALLILLLVVPVAGWAQRSGSAIATERIFEALEAGEGDTVCEIGAGDGDLTIAVARRVGPTGRVYTSELGDNRVRELKENVARSSLAHITVVEGDPARTNFPDAACDAIFMRNVYHHFAEPAAMNAAIGAALKPGGRLAVVDFAPSGTEAERPADRGESGKHGISADTLTRELQAAGFEPVASETGSRRWFMVVVAKPAS